MEMLFFHFSFTNKYYLLPLVSFLLAWNIYSIEAIKFYTKQKKLQLREEVRSMFQHAYEGYLRHASDYDELRPLTCDGVDTWGSYSLTLIDALDTLATMGNYTEFRRVVKLLDKKMNFDKDINVSVFETNIRIVGGLLSAHLLSKKAGLSLENGWPCQGPMLRMAENVAKRLLPAFDTKTGMPYGTVNLMYGVPRDETSVTCTAGVGTLLVEFGTLTRLTGNPIYEKVALNALHSLWQRRSTIGLFGNHIDVQTGKWTALDSGIGAGVDSFFEYLVKSAILLQRPELLQMFHEARHAIDKYLRHDDWYVWVGMIKGQVTLPVFQSLEAFWPGLLSMIGDIGAATKTFTNYASVWHKYGFLPEFYNIPHGEASPHRESYPLRPELVESALYLYRATKNEYMLEVGESILRSIEHSAKTKCGYATIRNVLTHEKENRMESFFLAETTKYLYLLFDEDNFLHNDAESGDIIQGPYGTCAINSGPYIFNTEAHPIDISALYCCHDLKQNIFANFDFQQYQDEFILHKEKQWCEKNQPSSSSSLFRTNHQNCNKKERTEKTDTGVTQQHQNNVAVDIEIFGEGNENAANTLIENFEKIKIERKQQNNNLDKNFNHNVIKNSTNANDEKHRSNESNIIKGLMPLWNLKKSHFNEPHQVLELVRNTLNNVTMQFDRVLGWNIFERNIQNVFGIDNLEKDFRNSSKSLWYLYSKRQQYLMNIDFLFLLNVEQLNAKDFHYINDILDVLNDRQLVNLKGISIGTGSKFIKPIHKHVKEVIRILCSQYSRRMVNITLIQEFVKDMINKNQLHRTDEMTESVFYNYNELITEKETLSTGYMDEQEKLEFFKPIKRVLEVRLRIIETINRLEALLVESKKQKLVIDSQINSKADPVLEEYNDSHIIEQIDEQETIMDTSEEKDDVNKTNEKERKQTSEQHEEDEKKLTGEVFMETTTKTTNVNDNANRFNSVWSQFVRTILRKTQPLPETFNIEELLQKTEKSLQQYELYKREAEGQQLQNYDLFSCKNPQFIERFAYRQFYP